VSSAVGEPVRLYAGPAPGSETWTHERRAFFSEGFGTEVVTNVVTPTLTPVIPAEGCGAAVIVAPGGAFHALSIDSEGFAVARRVAEWGVAAFVLEYRLVPSGDDAVAELGAKSPEQFVADVAAITPLAAADGARAVRLVRERAGDWGVDPSRVGFVGFSAGGNVALRVATDPEPASRPDFLAPIYAPLRGFELPAPPEGGGPVFIAAAADDDLGLAADSIEIASRWHAAGVPVELHLYARGGHGFGMRVQHLPTDTWIERFHDWLEVSGLLTDPG
jgi:acetyl esterase/lipase